MRALRGFVASGYAVIFISHKLDEVLEVADRITVLLISEDLEELLAIADRVAVLFQGRIMGVFPAGEADPERIGLLMGGKAEVV